MTALLNPSLATNGTKPHPRRDLVNGLRAMADFIEAHPDAVRDGDGIDLYVFTDLKQVVRQGLGMLKKEASGGYFYLLKQFSRDVQIRYTQAREKVCERVKVGEKVVPAEPERAIPAQPETIIPAKPERVEAVYGWKCPDSLLAEKPAPQPAAVATNKTDSFGCDFTRQSAPTDPSDLLTVDEDVTRTPTVPIGL